MRKDRDLQELRGRFACLLLLPVSVAGRRSGTAVHHQARTGLAVTTTRISGCIRDLISGNKDVSVDNRRQAEGGSRNRAGIRRRRRCNGEAWTETMSRVIGVIGGPNLGQRWSIIGVQHGRETRADLCGRVRRGSLDRGQAPDNPAIPTIRGDFDSAAAFGALAYTGSIKRP
jgi:hypothetical protein